MPLANRAVPLLGVVVLGAILTSAANAEAPTVPQPPATSPQPAVSAPLPGSVWQSPSLGRMMWIPPGSFVMGSPLSEPGRSEDELPHPVVVTRGFWLMEHEVTELQWNNLLPDEAETRPCGPACPKDEVARSGAERLAARASARDGVTYRLPTAIEWEWAARGGASSRYAGGDDPETVAWYKQNAACKARPVCTRAPNAYGLCDMSGSVWEWVWDAYYPYDEPPRAPNGYDDGTIRGGGDCSPEWDVRVAARARMFPVLGVPAIGFRLAVSLTHP